MTLKDIPEAWGKTVRVVDASGRVVVGLYDGYVGWSDSGEDRELLDVLMVTPDGFKYIEELYVDEIASFEVLDD